MSDKQPYSFDSEVVIYGARGGRVTLSMQLILHSVRRGIEPIHLVSRNESTLQHNLRVLASLLSPGENLFYSRVQSSVCSHPNCPIVAIASRPSPTEPSSTLSGQSTTSP